MTTAQLADLARFLDVQTIALRSAARNGTSVAERTELTDRLRDTLALYRGAGGGGRVGEAAEEVLKGEG